MNSSRTSTNRYLAVTQGTADWLQGKAGLLDALHGVFSDLDTLTRSLKDLEFVEGPVHISATPKQDLIALWNVDYLFGTGEEAWGFIKLDSNMGLAAIPSISREVFERCLYVINQRLQGLLLDGTYFHRSYANGTHTCLAARGTEARRYSIGYAEKLIERNDASTHAIVCVGPERDFKDLSQMAENVARFLDGFITHATELISPLRKRSAGPPELFPDLRRDLASFAPPPQENEYAEVQVATGHQVAIAKDSYRTFGLSYQDWTTPSSTLTDVQRRILLSDAPDRHPLRIVGPGGSGKTLLMQLLALRQLRRAGEQGRNVRILYVVHNTSMQTKVIQRFAMLAQDDSSVQEGQRAINVMTLLEYGRNELDLDYSAVIDPDAHNAKLFQLEQVTESLQEQLSTNAKVVKDSTLLTAVEKNSDLVPVLALLIATEISTAIKGHGLQNDERRYVRSERKLSRLHGALTPTERQFVFDVFQQYHKAVFEKYEVLDTDDIALSLIGRLRTPMWELKRRKLGYDYIFVDETQLFNENERRIFPYLTNGAFAHMPIVLALDQAQDVYGQATAGLATLGIRDIANESLSSIHRSTRSIVKLAFFVIQRSTDLFGPDFPDFTGIAERMEPDDHPLASHPEIIQVEKDGRGVADYVVGHVRELRKLKLRQIAVICHADQYWAQLEKALRESDLPLHVLLQRGERLSLDRPLVALARPLHAGGQEFDAVILVGLEQGVVPPRVGDNEALAAAVEQQAIREMYLSITRARYRVSVVIPHGANPTRLMREAERAGILKRRRLN